MVVEDNGKKDDDGFMEFKGGDTVLVVSVLALDPRPIVEARARAMKYEGALDILRLL